MGRRAGDSRKETTGGQSVGARLRDAREQRGLALREIADRTRISVMLLESLERGDLSRLPGGIFTRAFVRAYAEQVGLDPDRTVQEFIAELPTEAASATARPTGVEDQEAFESDRKMVTTAIALVLASLPIIGLAVYFGAYRHGTAVGNAEPGRGEVPAPAQASEPAALPALTGLAAAITGTDAIEPLAAGSEAGAPVAAAQAWGLTMEIAPTAACWVSVTVDGVPAFSGWMTAGETRVVQARERILVNAGDGGAFAYTVNGRHGRPLGSAGEPVSQLIALSNLSEFLAP